MAPTITSNADAGTGDSGNDIFAELGETLNSGITDDATGQAEGGETQEFAPVNDVDSGETEQPAEAQPTGTDPFPLSDDGKSYVVPKTEFSNYSGMKEYTGKVQARFPTVADAESAYFASSDFRAMQQDFMYPDQGTMERVLNFWSGGDAQDPGVRQQMQQSFAQMATRMPDMLRQINPQAYSQLSDNLVSGTIQAAYAKAAQTGDPADFQRAQFLDWGKTGQYKTELPKTDPQAEQRRQEQARSQDLERRESAMLERDFKTYSQAQMDGAKWTAMRSEIDKVLEPVKGKYDAEEFADIRASVERKLLETLQSDQEWARNHSGERRALESEYKRLWKSGQDPAAMNNRVKGYINDLMVRARLLLPSIAAPRLQKATARAVAKTQPKQAQARTQQPPNAQAPGNRQNGKPAHYNLHEDPEFTRMFQ